MAAMPCDVIREYEVPAGATAVCIEAESGGLGKRSSSPVVLQVRPGATVRLRFTCWPTPASPEDRGPRAPDT